MEFFKQLLIDGQADLALASVKLATYNKGTSAAAFTKAYRAAGLPVTDDDAHAVARLYVDAYLDATMAAETARAEAHNAKAVPTDESDGQMQVFSHKFACASSLSDNGWSYGSTYEPSRQRVEHALYGEVYGPLYTARREVEAAVYAAALAAAGLTVDQVGALQRLQAEAKK